MPTGVVLSWEGPTERGQQWIEIELDHPVNPWEHEGAGSVSWGAQLDRLTPLGDEAVSILQEAWQQRGADLRAHVQRQPIESGPVDRVAMTGASIKPGWAGRVELDEYWINLTLYQAITDRWKSELGKGWSAGRLIDDGVAKRGVTVEATTPLGRRALRIVEALHSAHPSNEFDPPESWLKLVDSQPHSALRRVLAALRSVRVRGFRAPPGVRRDRDSSR